MDVLTQRLGATQSKDGFPSIARPCQWNGGLCCLSSCYGKILGRQFTKGRLRFSHNPDLNGEAKESKRGPVNGNGQRLLEALRSSCGSQACLMRCWTVREIRPTP